MDSKSIKELEILHELSKNERINQRYLSKKLGMASGLVNLYLKRLAHKGYVKIAGISPRRLKYLVTPTGIAEKTRLTYEFALISYKYFKNMTDDINRKLAEIEGQNPATAVAVYGTDELTELCLALIKEFDIQVVAVVDDSAKINRFHGHPVIPMDVLRNLRFDKILIAKMDPHDEVESLMNEMGIGADKICRLLEVSEELGTLEPPQS